MFFGRKKMKVWNKRIALVGLLVAMLVLALCETAAATGTGSQHYRMISSIEYKGQTQYKHRTQELVRVRKEAIGAGEFKYNIATDNSIANIEAGAEYNPNWSSEVSFNMNPETRAITSSQDELTFFKLMHNRCVMSLSKVSSEQIDTTWKQSFDLSYLGRAFESELKFTVTAIGLNTEAFGDLVAVRAISEPFNYTIQNEVGEVDSLKCKASAVYVFDPAIEEVYLSVSVFEGTTKLTGKKETLRHELATYKTDAAGASIDLTGLGKKFEKLVRKVGLTNKDLKVKEEGILPAWAQFDGLRAIKVSTACSGLACEGALNPVSSIYIPASRLVTLQGLGQIPSAAVPMGTVSTSLAQNVAALGSMKIATGPTILGMSPMTAGGVIGGGVGGGVAAGGGGGSSSRSGS